MRLAATLALLVLAACSDSTSSTQPQLTGDTCGVYSTSDACSADMDCMWFGTGCACPPNNPTCVCSPGTCGSRSGTGSGSGSGTTAAGCACPGGGVCYEQVGGPAQMGNQQPDIECTTPSAGTGDPCSRIEGQGTCTDSTTVSGLCVCDNGVR